MDFKLLDKKGSCSIKSLVHSVQEWIRIFLLRCFEFIDQSHSSTHESISLLSSLELFQFRSSLRSYNDFHISKKLFGILETSTSSLHNRMGEESEIDLLDCYVTVLRKICRHVFLQFESTESLDGIMNRTILYFQLALVWSEMFEFPTSHELMDSKYPAIRMTTGLLCIIAKSVFDTYMFLENPEIFNPIWESTIDQIADSTILQENTNQLERFWLFIQNTCLIEEYLYDIRQDLRQEIVAQASESIIDVLINLEQLSTGHTLVLFEQEIVESTINIPKRFLVSFHKKVTQKLMKHCIQKIQKSSDLEHELQNDNLSKYLQATASIAPCLTNIATSIPYVPSLMESVRLNVMEQCIVSHPCFQNKHCIANILSGMMNSCFWNGLSDLSSSLICQNCQLDMIETFPSDCPADKNSQQKYLQEVVEETFRLYLQTNLIEPFHKYIKEMDSVPNNQKCALTMVNALHCNWNVFKRQVEYILQPLSNLLYTISIENCMVFTQVEFEKCICMDKVLFASLHIILSRNQQFSTFRTPTSLPFFIDRAAKTKRFFSDAFTDESDEENDGDELSIHLRAKRRETQHGYFSRKCTRKGLSTLESIILEELQHIHSFVAIIRKLLLRNVQHVLPQIIHCVLTICQHHLLESEFNAQMNEQVKSILVEIENLLKIQHNDVTKTLVQKMQRFANAGSTNIHKFRGNCVNVMFTSKYDTLSKQLTSENEFNDLCSVDDVLNLPWIHEALLNVNHAQFSMQYPQSQKVNVEVSLQLSTMTLYDTYTNTTVICNMIQASVLMAFMNKMNS